MATSDDYDGAPDADSPIGWGSTPRDAVDELFDQIELQHVADAARRIA